MTTRGVFSVQNVPMAGSRFRVVVADDVTDMRELIVTAPEASGSFAVVGQAADGAAAVEQVRVHRPDLALVDLAMPVVTGIDALPGMQAASPETRVIVVSGFPRGRLADVVTSRGALGYIEKGLSPKRLVDEVLSVASVLDVVAAVLDERRTQLPADMRSSAGARRFMEETLRRWDCG